MRISAPPLYLVRGPLLPTRLRAGLLASFVAAAAMLLSTTVFSEPAVADALMMVAIVALPVLGAVRFGDAATINYAMWFALVALGIAGTSMSTTFDTAIKHQFVTLFLATGAFTIAGYVSGDPEKRSRLILECYVVACLIATFAALVGYFRIIPSTYDLFTEYDRARGTFKDPNVYSAAMVPGVVTLVWAMLREPPRRALIASVLLVPLIVGLLVSFSRGAWISTVLALAITGWIVLVRGRRRTDLMRFGTLGATAVMAATVALGIAAQMPQIRDLLEQRANLDQSYDKGPDGRFGGQEKARALILANPFGIGTHTFRETYHHEEPHNVYLSMFLNAGWIGGLLYIVSVAMTLWLGLKTALRNSRLQGAAVIAAASFAGLVFEGFVIDTDHWRHFFILAGLIWGLADAVPSPVDPSRRAGDPVPAI